MLNPYERCGCREVNVSSAIANHNTPGLTQTIAEALISGRGNTLRVLRWKTRRVAANAST
ncbi:hypothetical protein [Nostoc sp.]|uniref:hypothetical protein n=1 Tax=Nostoc sp. TaxID=1180 RepID=UPI003592EB11